MPEQILEGLPAAPGLAVGRARLAHARVESRERIPRPEELERARAALAAATVLVAGELGPADVAELADDVVDDRTEELLVRVTQRTLTAAALRRELKAVPATPGWPTNATRRCWASRASRRRSTTAPATRSARNVSRELGAGRWTGA